MPRHGRRAQPTNSLNADDGKRSSVCLTVTTSGRSTIPVFIHAHSAWPSLRG